MTELEQQLTTALRALSAQYEQEQTRQAAQVAVLQQQVERLEGAVTHLSGQYTTLVQTLRARSR